MSACTHYGHAGACRYKAKWLVGRLPYCGVHARNAEHAGRARQPLHQAARWEVVHNIGGNWHNVSHEGGRTLTFATRQEARDDMREHFANMRVADMAFCETEWRVRRVQSSYHQES